MAVTKRATKGSALTWTEMDANWDELINLMSRIGVSGGNVQLCSSSGSVMIGGASSAYKLHVRGGNTNNFAIDNDGSRYTEFDVLNNGVAKVVHYWDNTNPLYAIFTVGSAPIQLQSGGSVLVGTSADNGSGAKLQVNGDISLNNASTYATATGGGNGAPPAQVSGYIRVYVNGAYRKIPFYEN